MAAGCAYKFQVSASIKLSWPTVATQSCRRQQTAMLILPDSLGCRYYNWSSTEATGTVSGFARHEGFVQYASVVLAALICANPSWRGPPYLGQVAQNRGGSIDSRGAARCCHAKDIVRCSVGGDRCGFATNGRGGGERLEVAW